MATRLRLLGLFALLSIGACLLTGRAAAQSATADASSAFKVVEVEGRAAIVGSDIDSAYQSARADAMRRAVEQIVGVYVESETLTQNFVLVRDEILSRTSGYASIERELERNSKDGVYSVRALVRVYLVKNEAGKRALLEDLQKRGVLRELRIMVVIPEEHRRNAAPVPIPDPAAETAIARAFLEHGFRLVDKETVQRLRDDRVWQQILRGQVDAARLHEIHKQTGADVLITGEAFSQSPGRIGNSSLWNCRARVEVKIILLATGEIIAADAAHAAGNEMTEELASKASLNNAGAALAPRLINRVLLDAYGGMGNVTARVTLEVSGLRSFSDGAQFEDALRKTRGVQAVRRESYAGGILTLEVEVTRKDLQHLPHALEQLNLPACRIAVRTLTAGKIEAEAVYPDRQANSGTPR